MGASWPSPGWGFAALCRLLGRVARVVPFSASRLRRRRLRRPVVLHFWLRVARLPSAPLLSDPCRVGAPRRCCWLAGPRCCCCVAAGCAGPPFSAPAAGCKAPAHRFLARVARAPWRCCWVKGPVLPGPRRAGASRRQAGRTWGDPLFGARAAVTRLHAASRPWRVGPQRRCCWFVDPPGASRSASGRGPPGSGWGAPWVVGCAPHVRFMGCGSGGVPPAGLARAGITYALHQLLRSRWLALRVGLPGCAGHMVPSLSGFGAAALLLCLAG